MSNESNFSYTTKINNDLFTVRGDTYDEFLNNAMMVAGVPAINALLSALNGLNPVEAQAVAQIQQAIPATVVSTPQTGVPQQSFAPVPPVSTPAPLSSTPTCHHGTKVAKKGNGAKGEWRGWMCPAPKGTPDQCTPQWVAKASPEWASFPA